MRIQKIKTILWVLTGFLALAVLGTVGCGMKKDYAIKKMLAYMKSKYGEEFTYVETYAGQYGSSYTMILVRSSVYPERTALVRLSEWEGRRRYEDNYIARLRKEELEQRIGELAKKCFGECKLYYKLPDFVFPTWFKADMSTEEFLQSPYAMAQFYIYPGDTEGSREEWEVKMEEFRSANAQEGYQIRGTLSLPQTEKDYEIISENTFAGSDYEGYQARDELTFSMDKNGSFRYIRWME